MDKHQTILSDPSMLAQLDIKASKKIHVYLHVWLTMLLPQAAGVAAVAAIIKAARRSDCYTDRFPRSLCCVVAVLFSVVTSGGSDCYCDLDTLDSNCGYSGKQHAGAMDWP